MEAQNTGVPAIVTEVPGNIDAVIPDQTRLHIPVEDPQALANAILKISENDELQQTMLSLAARNRVKQYYSEDQVMNHLINFHKRLLH